LLVCHCLGEKNIVIEKERRHLALLLLLVRWNSVRAKANVPNIGRVYLEVYIMLYDTALAITVGNKKRRAFQSSYLSSYQAFY